MPSDPELLRQYCDAGAQVAFTQGRWQARTAGLAPPLKCPPGIGVSFSEGGLRLLSDISQPDAPGGVTATVLLRIQVNSLGKIDKVDVVVSSGHLELDETAIDVVERARCLAAHDGPNPVSDDIDIRLT